MQLTTAQLTTVCVRLYYHRDSTRLHYSVICLISHASYIPHRYRPDKGAGSPRPQRRGKQVQVLHTAGHPQHTVKHWALACCAAKQPQTGPQIWNSSTGPHSLDKPMYQVLWRSTAPQVCGGPLLLGPPVHVHVHVDNAWDGLSLHHPAVARRHACAAATGASGTSPAEQQSSRGSVPVRFRKATRAHPHHAGVLVPPARRVL